MWVIHTSKDNTEVPRMHEVLITALRNTGHIIQYWSKQCSTEESSPVEMEHEGTSSVIMLPRQRSNQLREQLALLCWVLETRSVDKPVMKVVCQQRIR